MADEFAPLRSFCDRTGVPLPSRPASDSAWESHVIRVLNMLARHIEALETSLENKA